mmetsp:Transcript_70061/g.152870  ORF Transcript_70061/g.152870 Transcript_70061/m.152870 type:complete len:512 (-) Transcript_70061:317-1852(-)
MDVSSSRPQPFPDEAPSLLWFALVVGVVLWWLWPALQRLQGQDSGPSLLATNNNGAGIGPGMRLPHGPAPGEAEVSEVDGPGVGSRDVLEAGTGRLASELPFELLPSFEKLFEDDCKLLRRVLVGPPSGAEYTAAVGCLKRLEEILDRLFQAFGNQTELAKVSKLRESSDTFSQNFGPRVLKGAMQDMLAAAGFERNEDATGSTWIFRFEDPLIRLKGLTVRLVMQKSSELQKLRGPGRFLQKDNESVIPKMEAVLFSELVDLYKGFKPKVTEDTPKSSLRERNLEADVRIKLNTRRIEKGYDPMALHEGLASISRTLAEAQRTRARQNAADLYPKRQIAEEVRRAVEMLPLPPGFSVAHLHWSSTELPRLFGMANTRGGGSGTGKDADNADGDSAAEIMASECAGFWAARQMGDVFWKSASLIGVGAALDYTVNKGFVVALLVGFEPSDLDDEAAAALQAGLRRRAAAEQPKEKKAQPAVRVTPASTFGNRITGFRDINARKPPKPPGGG